MSALASNDRFRRLSGAALAIGLAGLLAGCDLVVMNPSGDVAVQQKNLILVSTALMLIVIVPVIVMTFLFAWRYRASDPKGTYDPDFHHSLQLEVTIWAIPLLIVMALGAMTWVATHTLDPFRELSRLGPKKPVPANVTPLEVQVVALDWKWLFIYPQYGVASVNEMAAPVDRPIVFKITSSSVWNTFYVPALAGMIYAMPGMQTQLNAVINHEGAFTGISGHYSGSGFSRMNFRFLGTSTAAFDQWVAKAKASSNSLTRDAYLQLEKPSEAEPVRLFNAFDSGLFDAILGMCVKAGQMCVHEMMHIDRQGGAGKDSEHNRHRLEYDRRRLEQGTEPPAATFPASGRAPRSETPPEGTSQSGGGSAGGAVTPPPSGGPAPAQLNQQPNTQPAAPHQH